MKLWDGLTTCLILLSAVHAGRLLRSRPRSASTESNGRAPEIPLHVQSPQTTSVKVIWLSVSDPTEEPTPSEFEDMVDLIKGTISRMRRSQGVSGSTRNRRQRRKGATQRRGGGRGGRARDGGAARKARGGQGCALKQIHLNVTDLGLGYRSSEEMIFRYCSGPCRKSETNYDKILHNLAHNKRLPPKDTPPQACCRPTAYDDDLSFLDDNLVYHTVRKHSARKCGCV
uniref:Glial cell line-derived neurotrophic factor n=1 Tax=Gasterosteus aculeatus TaxID=69293 RepID=G3NY44_GASAC